MGGAVVEFTRESEKTTWKRGQKKEIRKKKRGVEETKQR